MAWALGDPTLEAGWDSVTAAEAEKDWEVISQMALAEDCQAAGTGSSEEGQVVVAGSVKDWVAGSETEVETGRAMTRVAMTREADWVTPRGAGWAFEGAGSARAAQGGRQGMPDRVAAREAAATAQVPTAEEQDWGMRGEETAQSAR